MKKKTNHPTRLQEALVLLKYYLSLLGCKELEALRRDLEDPVLEGADDFERECVIQLLIEWYC